MSISLNGGNIIRDVVLLSLSSQFHIQWLNIDKLNQLGGSTYTMEIIDHINFRK